MTKKDRTKITFLAMGLATELHDRRQEGVHDERLEGIAQSLLIALNVQLPYPPIADAA